MSRQTPTPVSANKARLPYRQIRQHITNARPLPANCKYKTNKPTTTKHLPTRPNQPYDPHDGPSLGRVQKSQETENQ